MRLKTKKHIRFAGQITGVEGYVESAAMGLLAAKLAINEINRSKSNLPPIETATGSLLNHITKGAQADTFQPMNVNFGLFPALEGAKNGRRNRKERYKAYTERAKVAWIKWLNSSY